MYLQYLLVFLTIGCNSFIQHKSGVLPPPSEVIGQYTQWYTRSLPVVTVVIRGVFSF